MDRYQIGRVEGRWHNFVPPIQGGFLGSYLENLEAQEMTMKEKESDNASVGPVDTSNGGASGINYRRLLQEPQELRGNNKAVLAFLDTQTKDETTLTLTRYPSSTVVCTTKSRPKACTIAITLHTSGSLDAALYFSASCCYSFTSGGIVLVPFSSGFSGRRWYSLLTMLATWASPMISSSTT